MRYSQRQQQCLKAMGLVAWTSTRSSEQSSASSMLVESTDAELDKAVPEMNLQATAGFSGAIAESENVDPVNCASLADWLEKQPLTPFSYRGSMVSFTGADQATVVVVCMHEGKLDETSASLPLSSGCDSMLNLMIRAIDLPRAAIRQCVISRSSIAPSQAVSDEQGFDMVLSPYVRAVLVLELHDIWQDTTVESDAATMPACSLPIWRIPHPQVLMDNPSLKRRAWESLKCLKKSLAN